MTQICKCTNHFLSRVVTENTNHGRVNRDELPIICGLENTFNGVFKNGSVILFGLLNLPIQRCALQSGRSCAREDRKRLHLAKGELTNTIERIDIYGSYQ